MRMGLEKVKGRVLQEARFKAEATLRTAKKEAEATFKAAKQESEEREREIEEELTSEIEFIRKREESAGRIEAKKMLLAFRKEFVDAVFSSATEKLAGLPEVERKEHVKKLVEKAASDLVKVGKIHCNEKDAKFVKEHPAIKVDMLGGIIAESNDGLLRVDYSYETLLKQTRETMLHQLNRFLFEKK